MKKQLTLTKVMMMVLVSVCLLTLNIYGAEATKVEKTFKGVDILNTKFVSGDIEVRQGDKGEVKVSLKYTYPKDGFKPVMKMDGKTLILKEEYPDNKLKSVTGEAKWALVVPAGIKLNIVNVSGDCKIKKLKADVAVKLVSGDLKVKEVMGAFQLKTVSGDIKGEDLVLTKESNFKSVSGDVKVELGKTSEYDINMGTVSGDVVLSYNGNALKGSFKLKGQKDDMSAPVDFDQKEGKKSHSPFAKRTFSVGGETPVITMKTISGDVAVKK